MKILSNKSAVLLAAVALIFSLHTASAQTQTVADLTFPIPELGNCADRQACKTYCDVPDNAAACRSFAETHHLVRGTATTTVRVSIKPGTDTGKLNPSKAAQAIAADGGPGQCGVNAANPLQACSTYCSSSAHAEECVTYGKKHELFSTASLNVAEKVSAALEKGIKLPGGCVGAEACRVYCAGHPQVCADFARQYGLITAPRREATTTPERSDTPRFMNVTTTPPRMSDDKRPRMATTTEMNRRPLGGMATTTIERRPEVGQLPPEMRACLVTALGEDKVNSVLAGRTATADPAVKAAATACYQQFLTKQGMPRLGSMATTTEIRHMASTTERMRPQNGQQPPVNPFNRPQGDQNQNRTANQGQTQNGNQPTSPNQNPFPPLPPLPTEGPTGMNTGTMVNLAGNVLSAILGL